MKTLVCFATFAIFCCILMAQTSQTNTPASPAGKLIPAVFNWEKMQLTTTPNGVRRALFDGPTATVDKLHYQSYKVHFGDPPAR